MLDRYFRLRGACAAATSAAILAGCGTGTPASPPFQPRIATVPAASPWPPGGASLKYAGSVEQTTRTGGTATRVSVTVRQLVHTAAATFEKRPVVEYRGSETDEAAGKTTRTHFIADVATVPSALRNGDDVVLLYAAADGPSAAQETFYAGGNGVFDQIPHVPNARWNDGAARREKLAGSITKTVDVYRPDGSYRQNVAFVWNASASLDEYADANAVYQWPYNGAARNSTITFSPPGGGNIQIEFTNVAAFPITTAFQVPAWYSPSPVLAEDAFTDLGTAPIPPSCNVPRGFGSSATEIVERKTRLDVVYGQTETLTRTAYVAQPYGLVCSIVRDDLRTYYDYRTLTFAGTPQSETVSDEVLGLQKARVPKGASLATSAAALPLDARIVTTNAAQRLKIAARIYRSLRRVEAR
jgi:hypothetical protein